MPNQPLKLAVDEKVTASTQNQAFSALLFLYKHVLKKDLHNIDALRATHPPRLPVVMTKQEAQQVSNALPAKYQLIAQLLYGSGLRLIECLRLRVKDIDFDQPVTESTLRRILPEEFPKIVQLASHST